MVVESRFLLYPHIIPEPETACWDQSRMGHYLILADSLAIELFYALPLERNMVSLPLSIIFNVTT